MFTLVLQYHLPQRTTGPLATISQKFFENVPLRLVLCRVSINGFPICFSILFYVFYFHLSSNSTTILKSYYLQLPLVFASITIWPTVIIFFFFCSHLAKIVNDRRQVQMYRVAYNIFFIVYWLFWQLWNLDRYKRKNAHRIIFCKKFFVHLYYYNNYTKTDR